MKGGGAQEGSALPPAAGGDLSAWNAGAEEYSGQAGRKRQGIGLNGGKEQEVMCC